MKYLVIFSVVLIVGFSCVRGQDVDSLCLGCICEASTQCNVSVACNQPYPGGYFCGPFLISRPYWIDAGQPILQHDNVNQPGAFENCAHDLHCAAETVRGYMRKYRQDCSGDGFVSCQDFARLHKLGSNGCSGIIADTEFSNRYQACAAALNLT